MFRWHLGMYKSVDRLTVSNCKSFDAKFWTATSKPITKAIQLSRRWSREAEDGFVVVVMVMNIQKMTKKK